MVDFNKEYPLFNGQRENTSKSSDSQLKNTYKALLSKPMTMLELAKCIGVERANICRYISMLLRENKIALINQRKCTISGHNNVYEYTANSDLFPLSNQLEMF
jgi:predicted transcriptional regulator